MVPSTNTAQYGYRQLANAGVIVECNGLDDLVGKVEDFLRDFGDNTRVINARTRHLAQSRENYLPVILAKLMQLIGEDAFLPDSDLNITQNGSRVRVMHPDSNWASILSYEKILSYENSPINSSIIHYSSDKKELYLKDIIINKIEYNSSPCPKEHFLEFFIRRPKKKIIMMKKDIYNLKELLTSYNISDIN